MFLSFSTFLSHFGWHRGQEANDKAIKNKQYAESLYKRSQPIQGTLAEKYLIESRQISEAQHKDLRYLPSISGYIGDKRVYTPALLAVAKDNQGKLNHVQVIRLNRTGEKNNEVNISKQTYGKVNGLPIELNDKANRSVSYLFEGVETALSALSVNKKMHVMAMLSKSNFLNIDLNRIADKVVLGLDNDGLKTLSDKVIRKSIKRLTDAGKEVRVILPEKDKTDFNDVLKNEGYQSLSRQIYRTLNPEKFEEISTKLLHQNSKNPPKMSIYYELQSMHKKQQQQLKF